MDTFNFPYHIVSHSYPKGDSFQFGRGYQFTAVPQLPQQRTFRLNFNAMVYYLEDDGVTLDHTGGVPGLNMQALIDFYEVHRGVTFIYPHPAYGNLCAQFAPGQVFETPKLIEGGNGATEPLEIMLLEQMT